MRGQPRAVIALLALMCLVRFGLAATGYASPLWLLDEMGLPPEVNVHAPYLVRVWAIRDMALALLVVVATPLWLTALLVACVVIDCSDVLAALLGAGAGLFDAGETAALAALLGAGAGLFDAGETAALATTALLALVFEVPALVLVLRGRRAPPPVD